MPVNFESITFSENIDTINKFSITYSNQNIYELSGNKRLLKKLQKKELYPLAVKINNSTDSSLNYNDLKIEVFNDYSQVEMIDQKIYINKLKQKTLLYPLYLIGISTSFSYTFHDEKWHYSYYPTIIFTGIALFNETKSFFNNKKFFSDIKKYEMYNKTIPAKSQMEGIIFIKAKDIKDIKIRINEK